MASPMITYAFLMPAVNVAIDTYTAAKTFQVRVTENTPEGGTFANIGYTITNLLVPQGDRAVVLVTPSPGDTINNIIGNFYEKGHGSVITDPADFAAVGERVCVMADPYDGYRLESIAVVGIDGNSIPVSFVSSTTEYAQNRSFTMLLTVQGSSTYADVRTVDVQELQRQGFLSVITRRRIGLPSDGKTKKIKAALNACGCLERLSYWLTTFWGVPCRKRSRF